MDLALVWAVVIALAVLTYALLDGFDLGVGILFPVLDDAGKDAALASIAPVWDGNETWLVLGGGGLFAVFPLAYATLLPAFYAPIIAMLLALVLRGVAMEFRAKTRRGRRAWDLGFTLGSVLAALCQGIMVGAFIQGVEVSERQYSGGWFDWLSGFSLLCGFSVVLGYSLLGAGWLVMKTQEPVAQRVRGWLYPLSLLFFFAIVVVSSLTPWLTPRLQDIWFSWPNLLWLAPIPVAVVVVAIALLRAVRRGAEQAPFYLAEALFVVTFIGFGINSYPYIVPHEITIWEAAAPESSLQFLLVGTVVLLPLVVAYTVHSYWVFRGKVDTQHY